MSGENTDWRIGNWATREDARDPDGIATEKHIVRLETRIAELEAEVQAALKFRRDVTSAAINAHFDNAGGLRYDEVADAIKRLGKRIDELEGDPLGHWFLSQHCERLEERIVEKDGRIKELEGEKDDMRKTARLFAARNQGLDKRIAELEAALREIAEEERAFMADPIGEAGVKHRKAAIARKALEDG